MGDKQNALKSRPTTRRTSRGGGKLQEIQPREARHNDESDKTSNSVAGSPTERNIFDNLFGATSFSKPAVASPSAKITQKKRDQSNTGGKEETKRNAGLFAAIAKGAKHLPVLSSASAKTTTAPTTTPRQIKSSKNVAKQTPDRNIFAQLLGKNSSDSSLSHNGDSVKTKKKFAFKNPPACSTSSTALSKQMEGEPPDGTLHSSSNSQHSKKYSSPEKKKMFSPEKQVSSSPEKKKASSPVKNKPSSPFKKKLLSPEEKELLSPEKKNLQKDVSNIFANLSSAKINLQLKDDSLSDADTESMDGSLNLDRSGLSTSSDKDNEDTGLTLGSCDLVESKSSKNNTLRDNDEVVKRKLGEKEGKQNGPEKSPCGRVVKEKRTRNKLHADNDTCANEGGSDSFTSRGDQNVESVDLDVSLSLDSTGKSSTHEGESKDIESADRDKSLSHSSSTSSKRAGEAITGKDTESVDPVVSLSLNSSKSSTAEEFVNILEEEERMPEPIVDQGGLPTLEPIRDPSDVEQLSDIDDLNHPPPLDVYSANSSASNKTSKVPHTAGTIAKKVEASKSTPAGHRDSMSDVELMDTGDDLQVILVKKKKKSKKHKLDKKMKGLTIGTSPADKTKNKGRHGMKHSDNKLQTGDTKTITGPQLPKSKQGERVPPRLDGVVEIPSSAEDSDVLLVEEDSISTIKTTEKTVEEDSISTIKTTEKTVEQNESKSKDDDGQSKAVDPKDVAVSLTGEKSKQLLGKRMARKTRTEKQLRRNKPAPSSFKQSLKGTDTKALGEILELSEDSDVQLVNESEEIKATKETGSQNDTVNSNDKQIELNSIHKIADEKVNETATEDSGTKKTINEEKDLTKKPPETSQIETTAERCKDDETDSTRKQIEPSPTVSLSEKEETNPSESTQSETLMIASSDTTLPASAQDADLLSEDSMDLSEMEHSASLFADSFMDNSSNMSFAGTEESSEVGSSTLESRYLDTPSTSRQSGCEADQDKDEEEDFEGNPDIDDIDDVTFLSFCSKDELDLHLTCLSQDPSKRYRMKKKVVKAAASGKSTLSTTAEPLKQRKKKKSFAMKSKVKCWVSINYHALMNQLEESEEKMLEELEIHANREFLHPSLKEAGMCLHVSSLTTDPVGRVFILDPVGVDLSLKEPIKVTQRDLFFPQRTKTSDYTKVKGWRDDGKQLKTIMVPHSTLMLRAGPNSKVKLSKTKPPDTPEAQHGKGKPSKTKPPDTPEAQHGKGKLSKTKPLDKTVAQLASKVNEIQKPRAAPSSRLFKDAQKKALQIVKSSRMLSSTVTKPAPPKKALVPPKKALVPPKKALVPPKKALVPPKKALAPPKKATPEPVREPIKLILPKPKSVSTRSSTFTRTKSLFERSSSPVKPQTKAVVSKQPAVKSVEPPAIISAKPPPAPQSPKKPRHDLVPPITLAFKRPKTAAEAAFKGVKRAMIIKKPSPPVLDAEEESEKVRPMKDYAASLKKNLGNTEEDSKIPTTESLLFKTFEKPVTSKTTAFVSNNLDAYLKKDKNSTSTEFNPFSHPLLQNKSSVVTFQMPTKQQRGIKTLKMKLEERKFNALIRRRQSVPRIGVDGDTITVKPFIPPGKSLEQHIADESVKSTPDNGKDKTTIGRTKVVDKLYEERVSYLKKIKERIEQSDPDEPEYLGMTDDSGSDDVYSRSVTGPRILGHITGTCRTKATAINQRHKDAAAEKSSRCRTKTSETNVYKPKTADETITDPDVYEIQEVEAPSGNQCRTKASETVRYGGLTETAGVKSKTARKSMMVQMAQSKIKATQGRTQIIGKAANIEGAQSKNKWKTQLQIVNSRMMHNTKNVKQSQSQSFMPVRDPNSPPMKGVLYSGASRGKSKLVDSSLSKDLDTTKRRILEGNVVEEEDIGEDSDTDDVQIISDLPDCGKEFCRMGCVCDSLKEALNTNKPRGHCGKSVCMFKCICTRATDNVRILRHRKRPSVFNSEDMYFYDTVGMMSNIHESKKPRLLDTPSQVLTEASSCARTRLYSKHLPSSLEPAKPPPLISNHQPPSISVQPSPVTQLSPEPTTNTAPVSSVGQSQVVVFQQAQAGQYVLNPATNQLYAVTINDASGKTTMLPGKLQSLTPANQSNVVAPAASLQLAAVQQQGLLPSANVPASKSHSIKGIGDNAVRKHVNPTEPSVATSGGPNQAFPVSLQKVDMANTSTGQSVCMYVSPHAKAAQSAQPVTPATISGSGIISSPTPAVLSGPAVTQSLPPPMVSQPVISAPAAASSRLAQLLPSLSQPVAKPGVSAPVSASSTLAQPLPPLTPSTSQPMTPTTVSGSEMVSSSASSTVNSRPGAATSAPKSSPQVTPTVLSGSVLSTHPGLVKADIFLNPSEAVSTVVTPSTLPVKEASSVVESSLSGSPNDRQVLDPETGVLSESLPSLEVTTSDASKKKKKKKKKDKKEKKSKKEKKRDKANACEKHTGGSLSSASSKVERSVIPDNASSNVATPVMPSSVSSNVPTPVSLSRVSSNIAIPISLTSSSSNVATPVSLTSSSSNIATPVSLTSSSSNIATPVSLASSSSNVATPVSLTSSSSNIATPVSLTSSSSNVATPVSLTSSSSNIATPVSLTSSSSNIATPVSLTSSSSNITTPAPLGSTARPVPVALVPASHIATAPLQTHTPASEETSSTITTQSSPISALTAPVIASSTTTSIPTPIQLVKHSSIAAWQSINSTTSSVSKTSTSAGVSTIPVQPGLVMPPGACFIVPGNQPGTMIMQTGPLQGSSQPGKNLMLVPVGTTQPLLKQPSVTPASANPSRLPIPIAPAGPLTTPWQNIASKGGRLVIGSSSSGHLMMASGSKNVPRTVSSTQPMATSVASNQSKQTNVSTSSTVQSNQQSGNNRTAAVSQGQSTASVTDPTKAPAPTTSSSIIDITSSPPAGSASSKKIASGPMLIEIQSDCNWDKDKTEILSKIAKHTRDEGLQPGSTSMRVGKYVVEIVSKKEEVAAVVGGGVPKKPATASKQPVTLGTKVAKGITTFFPPSKRMKAAAASASTADSEVILIDDGPSPALPKKTNAPSSRTGGKVSKKPSNSNSPDVIIEMSSDVPEVIDIPDSPPHSVLPTNRKVGGSAAETDTTNTVTPSTISPSRIPASITQAEESVSSMNMTPAGEVENTQPLPSLTQDTSESAQTTLISQRSDAPATAPIPISIVKIPQNESVFITSDQQQQGVIEAQYDPPVKYRSSQMPTLQAAPAVKSSNQNVSANHATAMVHSTQPQYKHILPKQSAEDESAESSDVDVEGYEEDVDVVNLDSNLSSVVTNLKRKLGFPGALSATMLSTGKKLKVDREYSRSSSSVSTPNVKRKRKSGHLVMRHVLEDLMQPTFLTTFVEEDDNDSGGSDDDKEKMQIHNVKERQRREDLRLQFLRLNTLLLGDTVHAKVKILKSAQDEIANLERQAKQLRQVKSNLQEINIRLSHQMAKATGQRTAWSGARPPVEATRATHSPATATGVNIDVQVPEENLDPVQRIGPQTAQDRDEAKRHCDAKEETGYMSTSSSSAEEVDISQFVDSSSDEELGEIVPLQEHTSSRQEHTSSRQEHTSSRQKHTSSRQEHTSSRQEHTSSRQDHTSSRQEHTSSRQDHTSSRQEHTSSRQEHTSSRQEHTSSRQEPSQNPRKAPQYYRESIPGSVRSEASDSAKRERGTGGISHKESSGLLVSPKVVSGPSLVKSKPEVMMLSAKSWSSTQLVRTAFHAGLPQVVSARSLATSKSEKDNSQKQGQKQIEASSSGLAKADPIHSELSSISSQVSQVKHIPIKYREVEKQVHQETIGKLARIVHPGLPKVVSIASLAKSKSEPETMRKPARIVVHPGLPKVVSVASLTTSESEPERSKVPEKSSIPQPERTAMKTGLPQVVSVTSLAKSKPELEHTKLSDKNSPSKTLEAGISTCLPKLVPPISVFLPKLVPPISLVKPKSPKRSEAAAETWAIVSPKVSPVKPDSAGRVVSRNASRSPARQILPENVPKDSGDTSVGENSAADDLVLKQNIQAEKGLSDESESVFTNLKTRTPCNADINVSEQMSSTSDLTGPGVNDDRMHETMEICDENAKGTFSAGSELVQELGVSTNDPVPSGGDYATEQSVDCGEEVDSIEDLLRDQGIIITQSQDENVKSSVKGEAASREGRRDRDDAVKRGKEVVKDSDANYPDEEQHMETSPSAEVVKDIDAKYPDEEQHMETSLSESTSGNTSLHHLESSPCVVDAAGSLIEEQSGEQRMQPEDGADDLESVETEDDDDVTELTGDDEATTMDETVSAIENIPQPSRTPSPELMSYDDLQVATHRPDDFKDSSSAVSEQSQNNSNPCDSEQSLQPNNDSKASCDMGEQSQVDSAAESGAPPEADTNQNLASSDKPLASPDKKNKVDLMSCLGVRENPDGTMRVVLQGEYDDDAVEEFFARPEVMDYLEKLAMKKTQKNNPINNLF